MDVWPKMYLSGPVDEGYTSSKKEKHQSFSPKQGGIMVWTKLPFGSNMGQKIEKARLEKLQTSILNILN